MAPTFPEAMSLHSITDNVYETTHNPDRMGNTANIAYGGYALAAAVTAAHVSVPSTFHLYTATGIYLGPALTDRKLRCTVRILRSTRTFITKQVEVGQARDDGGYRACLTTLVDFQAAEPATLLTFSKPPKMKYAPPEQTPTLEEQVASAIAARHFRLEDLEKAFRPFTRYFDRRVPDEATNAQNPLPFVPLRPTRQDHLPVPDKTQAFWVQAREPLKTQADNVAAMAWLQDAALAFVPLVHSGLSLHDAGSFSSLEFALRVFVNEIDLNAWHLRESRCIAAGEGRTYSEAQVWDAQGRLVSSMTQQCILRPLPGNGAKI